MEMFFDFRINPSLSPLSFFVSSVFVYYLFFIFEGKKVCLFD